MENIIKTALKEGGNVLLKYFGNLKSYEVKQDQSNIVTQADVESEKVIVDIIKKNFPDHNIIAEETGYQDNQSEYTWIIDPLDGTSNFAAGIGWFGVNICILKNNQPFIAGIYLPVYDVLYYARKGAGAFSNGETISVSKETSLKNILMCYSLDYSEDISKTEKETKIIGRIVQNIRNLRATNSVIDFCYTADGRFGACVNQTTKIWDIAAPYLIINEAGGKVTDIDGNDINFLVDKSDYEKNFTIVGAGKSLHPQVMELILG